MLNTGERVGLTGMTREKKKRGEVRGRDREKRERDFSARYFKNLQNIIQQSK